MARTGEALNRKWNVGAAHALYSKDSNWYHVLKSFPGALFDPNGYVLFSDEEEYLGCKYLKIGEHIHVPDGIYSIPGYTLVENNTGLTLRLAVQEDRPTYFAPTKKKQTRTASSTAELSNDIGNINPDRVIVVTERIVRDTSLAKAIKRLHDYRCQICGLTVELASKQAYCEAHHIMPLGSPHNGPDVAENIICVCPNHHAQLDYTAIKIDLASLRQHPNHQIAQEYVNYHNSRVQNND